MTRSLVLVAVVSMLALGGRAAADPEPEPEPAYGPEQGPVPDEAGKPMAVDGDEWEYQPIDDGRIAKTAPEKFSSFTADREVFKLDIAPDGAVKIHDARNLRFVVGNPPPTRANERKLAVPRPPAAPVRDQDGERPYAEDPGPIGVSIARFDISDWMMRRHGDDPYASRKLAVLDATRERRAMIGSAYRASQLARAGEIMGDNLARLWGAVGEPAARRRELFALWDECAETGADNVVKAGADARARLVAFVARVLPPGSPDAFTAAELAEMNARRVSRAAFAPYDAPAAAAVAAPAADLDAGSSTELHERAPD